MRRKLSLSVPLLLAMVCAAHAQSAGAGTPNAPTPTPESYNPNASGIYKVGGDVRPPTVVSMVNPEFTEAARKKGISGNVQVALIVDEKGVPKDIRVVHGLGLGLDEKAVEAVRGYRFKPATKDGVPVPVKIFVNVNFQIF